MYFEGFDWSQIPSSFDNNEWWWRWRAKGEAVKLIRLLSAIEKWRDVVAAEHQAFAEEVQSHWDPAWDDFDWDPVGDEAFMLADTERAMFGTLGVSICSTTETFIHELCADYGVTFKSKKSKPDLRIACRNLSARVGEDLRLLPGADGNCKARELGNSYKHHGGKAHKELTAELGIPEGELVEYENQDWRQMIADTETVLIELVRRLDSAPPPALAPPS